MKPRLFFLFMSCSVLCFTVLQNQAKLFIQQKKIPFPVDNQNINEELGKFSLLFVFLFAYFNLIVRYTLKIFTMICFASAAIGYVLIGNGLYDEAIKHFSLLLQVCYNTGASAFLVFLLDVWS